MNTPITDAARLLCYDADAMAELSGRLEQDRAALMEACQALLSVAPAKAPAAGLLVGIEAKHKAALEMGKSALAAARANFPTP